MKKIGLSLLLAAGLAAGATGCFRHSYTTGAGGDTNGNAAYSKWHHHFLYGLIGEKDVNVRSVCPSGNATIEDEQSFLNGVVGALVGVIYFPTTVEVYCDGRTAQITLSPEQLRSIARAPGMVDAAREISESKARELAAALDADASKERMSARAHTPIASSASSAF